MQHDVERTTHQVSSSSPLKACSTIVLKTNLTIGTYHIDVLLTKICYDKFCTSHDVYI